MKAPKGQNADQAPADVKNLVQGLPAVSGSWGSGHLFTGPLFSAVITDDGRIAAGAVAPEQLYRALS